MKSPASNMEVMTQDRAKATNLEAHKQKQSHNQDAGMRKKIALSVLALATIALPAAAQNLTSFGAPDGRHLFYNAPVSTNSTADDVFEVFWGRGLFGWPTSSQDLTLDSHSSGPLWISNLSSFTNSSGGHLDYIDEVGHVNQLWLQESNAAGDFMGGANPSGPWTYGWSQSRGAAFTPLRNTAPISGSPSTLDAFSSTPPGSGYFPPLVFHNSTSNAITSSTALVPPGIMGFHPGPSGQNAIVRWTAPSNGRYWVLGFFFGLDTVGTTTDVAILHNGVPLFAGNVNGYYQYAPGMPASKGTSPTQYWGGWVNVAAGDAIDFTVGDGTDGNFNYDTTGLEAVIRDPTLAKDQDLTATSGTPVSAFPISPLTSFSNANGEHVFFIGLDGDVHQLWHSYSSGKVTDGNHTLATGAKPPLILPPVVNAQGIPICPDICRNMTPLTGFSNANGEHVYYIGADYDIYELRWDFSTQQNSFRNVTARASGSVSPAAANVCFRIFQLPPSCRLEFKSMPPLTSFSDANGEHLYFVGLDQHVHQIWHDFSTGGFHDQDLTSNTPHSVLASVDTSLTGFSNADGEYVFYVGTDQDVHQLSFLFSTGRMSDDNLTAEANVPGSAVASCSTSNLHGYSPLTSFNGPDGSYVYYVGASGVVHELKLYPNDSSWSEEPVVGGQPGYACQ
jgi:hypothetical protein